MGGLCVIMGTIGAYVLYGNISEEYMNTFNVANEFLMFHALALLGLAFMNRYVSRSYLNTIYYFFVIGIILFSGPLFISSVKELTGFAPSFLNKLAPIGSILLISGWITLILTGINYKHKKRNG